MFLRLLIFAFFCAIRDQIGNVVDIIPVVLLGYVLPVHVRAIDMHGIEEDLPRAFWRMERHKVAADVVFIDPPYERQQIYINALKQFSTLPLLAEDGVLIFESSKRKEMPEAAGNLKRVRTLIQGDSVLTFYRM